MTRFVLSGALLLLAACSAPRPARLASTAEPTAQQYDSILDTWTRSDRVYDLLDNVVFVTATYHAPEFRRAFAASFPDIYGTGGDVTRRELVELADGAEQFHTFFIAAHTPDNDWNDFHKDDSIWRMTLTGSNEAPVEPRKVESVRIDQNLRIVYTYLSRFDEAYLVRFPLADRDGKPVITEDTGKLTLRIASAIGVAEPTWKLSK